ncbi:MAG: alpha/beta hydrolase [Clostridia bacterium]|nr:alpha/beta hydrolase [Clostridia bacterium]
MKKRAVVYVHGKGGSADEAAHYEPLFPACDVLGFDYRAETPWDAKAELSAYFRSLKEQYKTVTLIAVSLGAYLAMSAGVDVFLDRAYFISPVVDMEALIAGMMVRACVTEADLQSRGVIHTDLGEDLSWEYLSYVRAHPIEWTAPTAILYGEHDSLTPYASVAAFADRTGASVTVMENGEHWFHTSGQMRFLDGWISGLEKQLR